MSWQVNRKYGLGEYHEFIDTHDTCVSVLCTRTHAYRGCKQLAHAQSAQINAMEINTIELCDLGISAQENLRLYTKSSPHVFCNKIFHLDIESKTSLAIALISVALIHIDNKTISAIIPLKIATFCSISYHCREKAVQQKDENEINGEISVYVREAIGDVGHRIKS